MENSALFFPTSQLLTANNLIFPSLNTFNTLNTLNTLSSKRVFDTSYPSFSNDLEPVKKHLRSDYSINPINTTNNNFIVIDEDDEEVQIINSQPAESAQKNNLENLLQLSLFSAYLDQVKQAEEVKRRYSEVFASFSQALFTPGYRDSDHSTNDSEIDSVVNMSQQNSPREEVKVVNKPSATSVYIDLESDDEDIVVHQKPVTPAKTSQIIEASQNNNKTNEKIISDYSELLADLPALQRKVPGQTGRRQPKMIWSPNDKKVEEIEKLTSQLEDKLSVKISNQERVCKLYSENGFSMENAVKSAVSQRSKYRFELKDKRAVVSLKTKSLKA